MDSALTDVDAPGDLSLAELLLVSQSEDFFDFAHGLPLSGQSGIGPPGRPILALVMSSAASPFSHFDPLFLPDSDHYSPVSITVIPRREKVIDLPGER